MSNDMHRLCCVLSLDHFSFALAACIVQRHDVWAGVLVIYSRCDLK